MSFDTESLEATQSEDTGIDEIEEPDTLEPDESSDGEVPEPRMSRRHRAAVEAKATQHRLQSELTKAREDSQREIATMRAEMARLQGGFSALQNTRQTSTAPAGPTVEDLEEQAAKALDDGSYSKHRELLRKAAKLEMDQREAAIMEKVARTIPKGPSAADIQQEMFEAQAKVTHRNLGSLQSEQRGALLQAFDTQFKSLPWGPDRWAKTYAAAEVFAAAQAGKAPSRTGFDASARGALGGAPGTGIPNRSEADEVTLTPVQRQWAKAAGMTEKEYKKYMKK